MTPKERQKTEPVTTMVQHEIIEGQEAKFENWSERIQAACTEFKGYLGTEVIKPVSSTTNQYISIFRFDSFDNLEIWMASDTRDKLIKEIKAFSKRSPEYGQYHSLEFMFPSETQGQKPPSREKMAVVTYLGLVPPVFFIPPLISRYITEDPFVGTLASLGIITPMMVYLIMPLLTKIAAPWLR